MKNLKNLSGARILLVEDNFFNQQVIEAFMGINDIEIKIAANGQEALAWLDQETFDGVLMDCQMPVMDGYEATRRLRQNESLKDLPIIALTASAMLGDRQKALSAGMNDYLTKPIDFNELLLTMTKWICSTAECAASKDKKIIDTTVHSSLTPVADPLRVDQSQIESSLQRLERLLHDFDAEALDVAVELTELSMNNEQLDILDSLTGAINNYDFETAYEKLRLLREALS